MSWLSSTKLPIGFDGFQNKKNPTVTSPTSQMPPPSVIGLWLTLVATAGTCFARRFCYVARARKGAVITEGLLAVTCSSPNSERTVRFPVTSAETASEVSSCRVRLFSDAFCRPLCSLVTNALLGGRRVPFCAAAPAARRVCN
jgi:hypothetical protein